MPTERRSTEFSITPTKIGETATANGNAAVHATADVAPLSHRDALARDAKQHREV
jgi:hypothetical protein